MIRCRKGALVTDAPAENVIKFLVSNRERLIRQVERLEAAWIKRQLSSDYYEMLRKQTAISTIDFQLARHNNLYHIVSKGYSLN